MDLEREVRWEVLLLQEFGFTGEEFNTLGSGHLVFAQPPSTGQRRSAIIVHAQVASFVRRQSFQSIGRFCCVGMEWGGWKLWLGTSHLFAGNPVTK